MPMESVDLARHRRALDAATTIIRGLRAADLGRPTPCGGWDLRALLAHMIGQNHGFADALERAEDVPVGAFAPRPGDDATVADRWEASVERVVAAFAEAPGERDVLLVEISGTRRFPAATVLAFHLLDTVVHTWDVASAVGRDMRPDDDTVRVVAAIAEAVPDGPTRDGPGAAFAPALEVPAGSDPWRTTLARVGRRADPVRPI